MTFAVSLLLYGRTSQLKTVRCDDAGAVLTPRPQLPSANCVMGTRFRLQTYLCHRDRGNSAHGLAKARVGHCDWPLNETGTCLGRSRRYDAGAKQTIGAGECPVRKAVGPSSAPIRPLARHSGELRMFRPGCTVCSRRVRRRRGRHMCVLRGSDRHDVPCAA